MFAPLLIILGLGVAAWCAVTADWSMLLGALGLVEAGGFAGTGNIAEAADALNAEEVFGAPAANPGLWLVGVIFPRFALLVFGLGFIFRLGGWLRAPLRENACLAEGQRRSLAWVKPCRLAAPVTPAAARLRRWRELFTMRSLGRNSRLLVNAQNGEVLQYPSTWLRAAGLLFHYSLLLVLLRHLTFCWNPAPALLLWLSELDGFFLLDGRPFYLSDLLLPFSLLLLLGRRFFYPPLRRISLAADYFALYLLLAAVGSGLALRWGGLTEAGSSAVKTFFQGWAGLEPVFPAALPPLFYLHLFFCSLLLFYFPFSKLMHLAGAWLAPSRSLPLLPFGCLGLGRDKAGKRRKTKRFVEAGGAFPPPVNSYAEYAAAFGPWLREAGLEGAANAAAGKAEQVGQTGQAEKVGKTDKTEKTGQTEQIGQTGQSGSFSQAAQASSTFNSAVESLTRPGGWALEQAE